MSNTEKSSSEQFNLREQFDKAFAAVHGDLQPISDDGIQELKMEAQEAQARYDRAVSNRDNYKAALATVSYLKFMGVEFVKK